MRIAVAAAEERKMAEKFVEFRIIPVERYLITRYENTPAGQSNKPIVEMDSQVNARQVLEALALQEIGTHKKPPGILKTDGSICITSYFP